MNNDDSRPGWEPDGTDADAAHISWMWNQKGQSVTYAFDLPDGATIHNVFAVPPGQLADRAYLHL